MQTVTFDNAILFNKSGLADADIDREPTDYLRWVVLAHDPTDTDTPAYDSGPLASLDDALKDRFELLNMGWASEHCVIECRLTEGYSLGEPEPDTMTSTVEEAEVVEPAGEDDTDMDTDMDPDVVEEREAEAEAHEPEQLHILDGRAERTTAVGQVSAVATARIARHDAALAKLGLCRPGANYSTAEKRNLVTEAGYAVGTAALDEAYDRLATSRRKWEQRPLIEDGMAGLKQAIREEQRTDLFLPARELRMADDGSLVVPNVGTVGTEVGVLTTLIPRIWGTAMVGKGTTARKGAQLFPSALDFLLSMPADERASTFNRVMQRASADCKVRLLMHHVPVEGGGRKLQSYACVGRDYARFDADKVAEVVGNALAGRDLRGEVTYEASSTNLTIDATYHADPYLTDLAAGDLFQVGFRFRSNDAGGGSIRGSGTADWNACLNFIILSHAEEEVFRQVHKGAMKDIEEAIVTQCATMQEGFEGFAAEWGMFRNTHIATVELWGKTFSTTADALEYGVLQGKLTPAGARDITVQLMLKAHSMNDSNDPNSIAALVDAVTRHAHMAMVDDCTRDKLEREAGAMVPVLARLIDSV